MSNLGIRYYSAGYGSCRKFLEETIPALGKKLGVNIEVESLDILDLKIYKEYIYLLDDEEIKNIAFPSLLIGNRLLLDDREISENLKQAIIDYTGQVYFPTIAYLVKLNQGSAFFYLAIYNISFIIPLFIVFILISKGTGSKAITRFFKDNMGAMKIGLSLLFLVLAGIVFWTGR